MRSLRMKMVMIMVILILALMLTTGAFLMSGVGNFYVSQFYEQMEGTFTPEFIAQLQRLSAGQRPRADEGASHGAGRAWHRYHGPQRLHS